MESTEDLQSWQQAFEEHSIPSTRAIEKKLRANVANDKGKLRGLVGENYRELLASAEQIVLLDVQNRKAETRISELGQSCQPHDPLPRQAKNGTRRRIAVQLRVLQRALIEAKTALRNSDLLQCARLIAVARLLAKSLMDEQVPAGAPLRDKITSLRKALLRSADSRLASPLTEPSGMVQACCAYCLVTSASSVDAVKHVQRLRLDRLNTLLSTDSLSQQVLVEALRYYLDGLHVLKGLAGRVFVEALGNLQKRPILDDQSLRSLELLDLPRSEALLPGEIRSFMPYFKRTPLTPEEAQHMLDTWSSEACQTFLASLKNHLKKIESCSDLLQLRRELYVVFLPVYFTSAGSSGLYMTLRTTFEGRIKTMSIEVAQVLSTISFELSDFDPDPKVVGSLWQPELVQMPLTGGGQKFLQQVGRRRLGESTLHAKSSKAIRAWILSAQTMREELLELHQTRWRDHLEEPDEEQEHEAEQIVKALTHQDPELWIGHLQKSLRVAVAAYESTLSEAVGQLVDQEGKGQAAVNLLRAIRDSLAPLQRAFPVEHRFDKVQSAVPQLHSLIATEVVSRLSKPTENTTVSSSAQLDDLPSPRAFAFLQRLSCLMLEVGSTDVWSPGAVRAVKEAVASHIFHEDRKKQYIETAFDDGYLRMALQQPLPEVEAPRGLQKKAVADYWSRTKLLFGMLAP